MADRYFAGDSGVFWAYMGQAGLAWPGVTWAEADREMALIHPSLIASRNVTRVPVREGAAPMGPILAEFGALHLSGAAGVVTLLAKNRRAGKVLCP